MKILGIDPGLAIVGFGQINTEPDFKLIRYGVIRTAKESPESSRLVTIFTEINKVIKESNPDLVAIEKLFFHQMGNTISIAQARGVILLALRQNNIPFIELTPSEVKKEITGNGKAKKKDIQVAVSKILSLPQLIKPDDAADAVGMAICGARKQMESYTKDNLNY